MEKWLEKVRKAKKDQILILLLLGVLLVVIVWPMQDGSSDSEEASFRSEGSSSDAGTTGLADSTMAGTGTSIGISQTGTSDSSTELEARLEQILSQVEGVGETRVMITLKSSGRKVVEKDTEQTDSRTESTQESDSSLSEQSSQGETTIYEKDSDGTETPFVTEELAPEILGVLVIAQGADSATTVTAITEAVMALFGIEAHKIKVMKME